MGMYDGLQEVPSLTAPPPPAPPSMYDGLAEVTPGAPKAASGLVESLQAGFQGSAPGLAWRGKLPDLVMDPQHSAWWERAATGIAQVASELPLMSVGGAAGGALGAAGGTAIAPGPGTAIGTILGSGAGMFAVPAAIRESLIQAYKSGEIKTSADWFNIVREVATTTAKEAGIGAATFGAGSVAARTIGKSLVPAIGESIAVPTAVKAIGAADTAAQIATMVTMPAALQGRLPDAQEFMDAAIVIGGLKMAAPIAERITNVFRKTGKTPAEQVQDAMADPKVADELRNGPQPEPEWTAALRGQLTKQEELWTIQDRLAALDRREAPAAGEEIVPLTPGEGIEREALRVKAAALEAEGVTPEVPRGSLPSFAPEQLVEAKNRAAQRIAELTTKEGTGPLTDVERAERIGLVNSLANPEALAKRYGIEPAIRVPTAEERDASAKTVYDDVYRQLTEADQARQASGIATLGDAHARTVAEVISREARTYGEALGRMPEDVYKERYLTVRDNSAAAVEEAAAAIPPEATSFVPPPEVDLFGAPILPTNAPRVAGEAIPVVAIPLGDLKLSKDVPQFKAGANARGVVQPLQGEVDLRGVAPIAVWERLNGDLEVISGRHRLDLWERKGMKTIDAQIFREKDGFDLLQATMLDAEMNIRDEHGSVSDYANYFKNSGISEPEAKSRGLLGRAKGQSGFRIAHDASPDLLAAHRAGLLSDDAALVISGTAPGSERLQALGIAMVNDGKSTLFAANMMRTVDLMASERMAAGQQGDIFGFDDSAMREAAAMAKKASSAQRKISEQISAVSGASRRPELARKMGVDVQDPEGIQKKIAELKQEQYQWDNWPLYPELVAKLRASETGEAKEPQADYTVDHEVRQETGRIEAGGAETPEGQFDLFAPAPIPNSPVKTLEKIVVEPEQVGKQAVSFNRVRDAGEAASIFQDLNRSPMEKFQVLGLDEKNKPIAFFDLFAGTVNQTSVYPREVWTAIYQTPGIKSVWIAHQHPSGLAEPSNADRILTKSLQAVLTPDIGVTLRGHLIITNSKTIDIGSGGDELSAVTLKAGTSKKTIPIMERKIVKADDVRESLSSPAAVRGFLKSFSPDDTGLLVLDSQNRATGWWPMTPAEMATLRTGDANTGMGALIRNVGRGNANAVIAYSPKPTTPEFEKGVRNAGTALKLADVNMLDAFTLDEQGVLRSHAEAGLPMTNLGGTFFQSAPRDIFELKPETPAELKARDEEAAAAARRKLAQERAGVKGPVPTVDQADLFSTQRTLFQSKEDKPWYYSELARSVEASPMKQGTAKAWQDYIKSRVGKGVKPEEIEATGINDWLATQEGKLQNAPFERAQRSYDGALTQSSGEAGEGVYAYPSGSAAMRDYYTKQGETRIAIAPKPGAVIVDLTTPEARKAVVAEAKKMAPNGKTTATAATIQRHPWAIKAYLFNQKADGYLTDHNGPGIPTGKQLIILNEGAFDHEKVGPTKVTKEQVQAFMEQGGVKVTETVLGEPAASDNLRRIETRIEEINAEKANIDFRIDYDHPENWTDATRALVNRSNALASERASLHNEMVLEDTGPNRQTKFDDPNYKLPGAVPGSYRELVLTLPARAMDEMAAAEAYYTNFVRRGGQPEWADISEQNRAQFARTMPDEARNAPAGTTFESSHFPEAGNYLAHTRVNDRMVPIASVEKSMPELAARMKVEGRTEAKMLGIEEFQNDRQAAARKIRKDAVEAKMKEMKISKEEANKLVPVDYGWKEGDGKKAGLIAAAEDQYQTVRQEAKEALGDKYSETIGTDGLILRLRNNGYPALSLRLGDALNAISEATYRTDEGIPVAPMSKRTDAWTGLVLKRLLRYAAEGNYDGLYWTTGAQQVERYTQALRKAVDVIEWKKTPEGVQIVGYKGDSTGERNATLAAAREKVTHALRRLDFLGFDSAEEARNALYESRHDWFNRWEVQGESDRANIQAYLEARRRADRLKVVDTTEKESALSDAIGKSMADRIRNDPNQTGTIEGENITVSDTGMAGYYDRIVPKVAEKVAKQVGGGKVTTLEIGEKAQPVRETNNVRWYAVDRDGMSIDDITYKTKAEAEGAMLSEQQAIEITPAMREKIMAGQALFQNKGQDRGDQHLASYNVAERLITLFEHANKSSVIHEVGHHFLENLKHFASQPDAPQRIKDMWTTARQEFAIGEDGEISTASHEMNARSFERYLGEGVAPSAGLRAVFAQFKTWMLEIYGNLQNLGVNINPEIRGLFDKMLATDQEIADARELDVPRAYVPEARAAEAEKIVPSVPPKKQPEPGFKDEQLALDPFAKELLEGPGSGPTEDSRVNAKYINGPMDLKLAIQKVAEIDQAGIQAARGGAGGVKSWEQANAEAESYITDVMGGKMVTTGAQTVSHDILQRAAFKVMVSVAKYSLQLRDVVLAKGDNATIQDQFDYLNSIVRMRMTQAEFLGLRAASARAMNQIRDMTPDSGAIDKMVEATSGRQLFQDKTDAELAGELKAKLTTIMAQHFSGKSALDIARLQKDIKDLKGQLKFSKAVTEATTWDKVVEGWRAGLLSGPVTHTTNLFGTGAFQVLRTPVDALAAIIGMARGASPGTGESDRATMSDAIAGLGAYLGGIQDGLKVGYHQFMLDEITGKTESHREAIPGRAGEIIRIPLRMMGAEDAMVTTMYERKAMRQMAMRTAFDEQMNPATREFAKRVDELLDNPTMEMLAAAKEDATRMTFNAPLGEKGAALQSFVAKWNLQWMIPFIRTPINIAKELLRMSPFAPAVAEWRQAIGKGGIERDKALAEIALGTGITALTMAYAFAGNISGAGSPDPGKNRGKAGVWQPYSILIGDTWYEYARIQPTGTLMGMAADIATIWDHMTPEELDKVPKMLAAAFAQAITNQTFLQGITNFVNAISDPTRFGPRFLQSFAGSMVPNVIGQPTAMADPVVREVNGMIEAIQARIPGFRQQLLPKRDWLGEEVPTKERLGVVMPVRVQEISDDKVRLEAARLDISLAGPPKKTHIGKGTGKLGDVELTPEERNIFAKVGGEMAHGVLTNVVNAPGYDEMPDLVKRKVFAKVLHASHQIAAVAALPPDKRVAYITSISEKVASELAPAEQ